MNNLSPNKTDSFFRQGLKTAPEISPSEGDWKEMERLLNGKPNKRPLIGWIYWSAGIAAGLLIFFSLWLSREPAAKLAAKNEKVEGRKLESQKLKAGNILPHTRPDNPENINELTSSGLKAISLKAEGRKPAEGSIRIADQNNISSGVREQTHIMNYALYQGFRASDTFLSDNTPVIKTVSLKAGKGPGSPQQLESVLEKPNGKLALSMAFTTDMNSVNGMGNSKAGFSVGMGLNYKLSKIISAGTGIYYSQKKYTADKYSYYTTKKPFATWASYSKRIDADCAVIDIPLNMSVLISKTKKTGIIASAGLSSYIMLSEKYNFIYTPTPARPSTGREYTIENANQHILSIVNLSVGIEKPLGNQSSIVIQPYAKLPLSGIGQGETELKSIGIGFQLNYSMKKKNKFFNRKSE